VQTNASDDGSNRQRLPANRERNKRSEWIRQLERPRSAVTCDFEGRCIRNREAPNGNESALCAVVPFYILAHYVGHQYLSSDLAIWPGNPRHGLNGSPPPSRRKLLPSTITSLLGYHDLKVGRQLLGHLDREGCAPLSYPVDCENSAGPYLESIGSLEREAAKCSDDLTIRFHGAPNSALRRAARVY
jgi:hypothetical protein